MTQRKVRLGVVGLGSAGSNHAKSVGHRIPKAERHDLDHRRCRADGIPCRLSVAVQGGLRGRDRRVRGCLRARDPAAMSGWDGFRASAIAEAGDRILRTGRPTKVPTPGPPVGAR
jgi:hypothetical protein